MPDHHHGGGHGHHGGGHDHQGGHGSIHHSHHAEGPVKGDILYIDACGGASGDMLAGALLDLGWPLAELEALVEAMGLKGVGLERVAARHMGIAASRLEVKVPPAPSEHHPHRNLPDVLEIVSRLPQDVAQAAGKVFRRLAEAEGRVHGIPEDQVHFHEVGAVDAMVDVTAFCAGLAWLGWPRVMASPLPLGRGFVDCAHGRIPLPAPAVLALLEGVPATSWPGLEETVTPTGAALITTFAESYGQMPDMVLSGTGIGCGSRESVHGPNIVRLVLGEEQTHGHGRVVEITCHIDDQSPEDFPLVLERLMAAGALDAAAAPLYMKKGRPGLMLKVIAHPHHAEKLARLVLEETTTLGVRINNVERRTLAREIVEIDTPWGPVPVKRTKVGGAWRNHPESDDVARISRETGLPTHIVRQKIIALAEEG